MSSVCSDPPNQTGAQEAMSSMKRRSLSSPLRVEKVEQGGVTYDGGWTFGWPADAGPIPRGGCCGYHGHFCCRPLGHAGRCWDGGEKPKRGDAKCASSQRPKDWDASGRAEANR